MYLKLVAFFLFLQSFSAHAQLPAEALKIPKLVAIQNKANYLSKDVSFHLGVLPSDAFNKGITFGVSYTKFFSQYSAWEIINIQGNLNIETSLKKDLIDLDVAVVNSSLDGKLDPISFIATTSYVYTPFYSKSLLFNTQLINSETSFILGLGGLKFKTVGFQPLINIGAYSRFYTSLGRSLKFEFKWNFHGEKTGSIGNFLYAGVAYSMQLGELPKHLTKRNRLDED